MALWLRMLLFASSFAISVASTQAVAGSEPPTKSRTTYQVEPVRPSASASRQDSNSGTTERTLSSPQPTALQQRQPAAVPVRAATDARPGNSTSARTASRADTGGKIYDRDGRLLSDMRPVGQNRAFDTRTGRYYDTVPMADGQRVVR